MGYKETVLSYISAYDRRMSRRNMIAGGLATAAVVVAGGDAVLTLRRHSKIRRELEKIRPHVPDDEIANAHELIGKYKNCQVLTDGKCNEMIKPENLAELQKAETLIERHNIFVQRENKQLIPEENRLKLDVLGGTIIPTIIVAGRAIRAILKI